MSNGTPPKTPPLTADEAVAQAVAEYAEKLGWLRTTAEFFGKTIVIEARDAANRAFFRNLKRRVEDESELTPELQDLIAKARNDFEAGLKDMMERKDLPSYLNRLKVILQNPGEILSNANEMRQLVDQLTAEEIEEYRPMLYAMVRSAFHEIAMSDPSKLIKLAYIGHPTSSRQKKASNLVSLVEIFEYENRPIIDFEEIIESTVIEIVQRGNPGIAIKTEKAAEMANWLKYKNNVIHILKYLPHLPNFRIALGMGYAECLRAKDKKKIEEYERIASLYYVYLEDIKKMVIEEDGYVDHQADRETDPGSER